jgi:hypothetical protein
MPFVVHFVSPLRVKIGIAIDPFNLGSRGEPTLSTFTVKCFPHVRLSSARSPGRRVIENKLSTEIGARLILNAV